MFQFCEQDCHLCHVCGFFSALVGMHVLDCFSEFFVGVEAGGGEGGRWWEES